MNSFPPEGSALDVLPDSATITEEHLLPRARKRLWKHLKRVGLPAGVSLFDYIDQVGGPFSDVRAKVAYVLVLELTAAGFQVHGLNCDRVFIRRWPKSKDER